MATKLARLSELYKPKSGDEQKFVAKHVVAKHDDVSGNKDDVFQATNVKTVEREKDRHGYAPGKDEEVYEEVEQVDEKLHSSATAGDYVKDFKKSDAPQFKGKSMKKRRQMAIAAFLSKGSMKEETEQIEGVVESSNPRDLSKISTERLQSHWDKHKDKPGISPVLGQQLRAVAKELSRRKKQGMKEETEHVEEEQLDELKKSTLMRYATKATKSSIGLGVKASRARDEDDMETWAKNRNKAERRDRNVQRAVAKVRGEEVEQIEGEQLDELKKSTIRSYANKKQAELDDVPSYPFKKKPMSKQQHANAARGMMGALQRLSGRKPTSEEVEHIEGDQLDEASYTGKGNHRPGWMLRADPELAKKFKEKKELARKRQAAYGNPAAAKSVKEDVEQIDELSSDTLRKYMRSARKSIDKNTRHLGDAPAGSKRLSTINKRVKGYRQAWKKAEDKENMGEEYSTGLLELYANLNDENRADMIEMFENDKDTLMSFVEQFNGGEE